MKVKKKQKCKKTAIRPVKFDQKKSENFKDIVILRFDGKKHRQEAKQWKLMLLASLSSNTRNQIVIHEIEGH